MELLKPNDRRAKMAIAYVWIVTALDAAMLLSDYFQLDLLQGVANGGSITTETAQFNDLRQRGLAIAFLIFYIVSAVTFILWFRRAYYNLHRRTTHLQFKDNWAAGAWFVPFINLARPYQIMKDLYSETPLVLAKFNKVPERALSTTILGYWWALWLINGFVGQISFRMSMHADTLNQLINSTEFSMVGSCFGIVLGAVTVKVIKNYAAVESLLQETGEEPLTPGSTEPESVQA